MTGEVSIHHAARLCERVSSQDMGSFQPLSTHVMVAAAVSSSMLRFRGFLRVTGM